jgi:hypothetical protein
MEHDTMLDVEQERMLSPAVYRRLHLNEWTAPDDRLTNLEDLRECITHRSSLEPQQGTRYVIGVDLAVKRDSAVAAICHSVRDPATGGSMVVLDHLEVWEPRKLRPVRLAVVRTARSTSFRHSTCSMIHVSKESGCRCQLVTTLGCPGKSSCYRASASAVTR